MVDPWMRILIIFPTKHEKTRCFFGFFLEFSPRITKNTVFWPEIPKKIQKNIVFLSFLHRFSSQAVAWKLGQPAPNPQPKGKPYLNPPILTKLGFRRGGPLDVDFDDFQQNTKKT